MLDKEKIIVEICAPSVQSAINADLAGADRIELCQNLNEGGTTPSFGAIAYCTEHLGLKTNVLIRPRTGSFCYNEAEFETIKHDVKICKSLGVNGVVVGFLNPDLTIDVQKTKEIVEIAAPMEVTFHRAFDICAEWKVALEEIITCGCSRILTSGTKPTALEGKEILNQIVQQANGRIVILAGSGINYANAEALVNSTGVKEIHASCTAVVNENEQDVSLEQLLDESNFSHKESNVNLIKKLLSLPLYTNQLN
ncbi:MAG TPA: copper homeostasis protein CutC [Bacteroidales bacterium]|nr:copper homeostasis protein CutC [Bacteroidales bacterium]HPS71504.1 copper homeostasis protein CutC [Bacteroidales bacterium]